MRSRAEARVIASDPTNGRISTMISKGNVEISEGAWGAFKAYDGTIQAV
jgi:hypothetical protein